MWYRATRVAFLFFLPVILAQEAIFPEIRFKHVATFGDSYTDTGNVFKVSHLTWPRSPPYFFGRFCNGPNWVDQLKVRGVDNYAYGSATTDNNFVQGYAKFNTIPIPGIRQQIATFLSRLDADHIDLTRTLCILWGGGNDFIFNSSVTPPAIAVSLLTGVQDLLARGAKHILVFNEVPARYIPLSLTLAPPSVLSYLTTLFNNALTTGLATIQQNNPQASLNIFDINSLITKVVTSKSDYFTNTTSNCWKAVNATTIVKNCNNPDKYVFLDTVHFTTRVHGLIADAVRQFLLSSYAVNSAGCYVHQA